MSTVKYPVALVATLLWIGFICAISFMEAWLKFRAPGVTLAIGLSIGRLIFAVLNKIEWVLAIAVVATIFWHKAFALSAQAVCYAIAIALLLVQSIWVLPALDYRAELIIQQHPVQSSYLHFYYVGMEVVKLVSLSIAGFSHFKTIHI